MKEFENAGFSPKNSEIFLCKNTSFESVIISFVREVCYSSSDTWPDMLTSALDRVGFQWEGDGNQIFYIIDLYGAIAKPFVWDAKVKIQID